MTTMRRVGVRELKTRLGTYLRLVQEGVTLVVTDRGEPVAELRPLPASSSGLEGKLRRLAAIGLVTSASRRPVARRRVRIDGGSASQTVVEDRGDRL